MKPFISEIAREKNQEIEKEKMEKEKRGKEILSMVRNNICPQCGNCLIPKKRLFTSITNASWQECIICRIKYEIIKVSPNWVKAERI